MCNEYNGYTNYETWNIALWIDNEEGSQTYWDEQAANHVEEDRKNALYNLANQLEEETREGAPEVEGTYEDLLGAALSSVDWREIAANMIENVEEEEEEEEEEDELITLARENWRNRQEE